MSDEKQKPEFHWFSADTDPYAVRIEQILKEAEDKGIAKQELGEMVIGLGLLSYHPPLKSLIRLLRQYWYRS